MPKYKPLYSLYKGLKESKYDVPDSYVSFQKTLTQAGDAGAKSRRGLYKSLKESNYDVPDTYEDFYKNLFVPVNSTTSRALKIGENPNTPAVNRYHQKLFDSVDPNKNGLNALSYRAVSQAKRAMNNVRKPVTAKVVDKKGKPTGEEFAITPAKTVEDLDREYAQETTKNWDNELHDQMADADKDAAKISDMFKSFIGSTDEVGSVWGNMTRGGGIAGTPHSVTTNNGILENTEARQLLAAGDYNRKRKELLQLEQDSRNGATFDNHSFFRGMYDAAKDTGILTGGASDLINAGSLLATKQDLDNGVHTKAGDMLMQQAVKNSNAQSQYGDNQGWMYTGGVITTNMAPFMVQIASAGFSKGLSTSIGKVVQGAASKVALGTMKKAAGFASADLAKNIGKVTGLTTKAFGKAIQYGIVGAAQANTVGLGNVANDVINRYTGQVYQDEQGNYKFGTFGSDGKLVHEGGEDFLTAFVKGEAAQTIEFATELAGGGIDAAGTALKNFVTKGGKKIINKYNMENVSKVIDFLLNNKVAKNARYLKDGADRTLGKVEVNSIVGESLEEELGIIANTVFTGDNKISDLWDEKQQSQIWGGMLLSIGLMKGVVAPFHAYNAKQYYSYKHKLNKADVNLSQLLGKEKWEELRNQIDATTNEDMPEMVNKINRDVALDKNRQPVREYIQNLLIMRGYDIGNMLAAKKAVEDKGEGVSVKNMEKNQAYQQGRDAYGYDTHEIQLDQEDKQKSLAQLLGISEQQLASMSDEELESFSGRDDNIDRAIYDYQLSSARYEGVVDNARDQIDLEVQRAAQAVDMYTDKSRNTIRNATIKASGGLEDYGVYIISGNIATHDDGSIDVSNSDDMILYYDPTTNTVEHADAMMFAELGSEENADEVRSQAMADAKEKAIKETTGIIDGVVEVGTQFKTVDADGTEHTYEVLADNGDGTAMITIDGNVPTEIVKGENVQVPVSFEELQKMKDESDQQRLQAAKAQREQVEKERAAQQTQETEQTQPSFDFNQILNDDGNVVLADVLGKDGNTKYPNSQLFLIRDSGAKAKVVELTSDGSLIPHAVNKKDVRTATTMTLDEYKQAFAASSMIEDNSGENRGEIEAEPTTIEDETTPEVAENTETTAPADETAETPSTEQTPAITLEDGTIVPMLEDGNPDFSKLTAAQTAELYDNQFGEDADSIVSGYVSDAKKALDKANNMTVKGKTFVEQKAAKDAKEKAIADAQAAYDSAIAIRDAYNERQLAKVEDTAEGRKNLIEKARRKFARLKSAVKDDAEAVAQIYKETVGSLLHRLYDGTGIDVTDTIPLTAEEYVASNLGAHSLNYEGTETSKGVKQETGLSREDFAKTQLLAADGKGTTIDALVHSLWENRPSNLDTLGTQDIRNALIDVLTSGFKASEARSYVENIRIAQAEKLIEEERTAAENAAYYEQQKAKEEEEKKKAEEKKAEEEKAEDNENTEFPGKLKEGSKVIEVPEDATDENPLGLQLSEDKVPFEIEGGKSGETYNINDDEDRQRLINDNKVDDKDILDIDMPKHVHKAIKELCKKMGLKVQFLYMGARSNGWIENGTMYLALDTEKATQFVFGHEMTHAIKQKNPEAYKELVKVAMAVTTRKKFEEDLAKVYQNYHGISGYNNVDDYVEEVVADNLGKFINDFDLAQKFSLRLNHPVLATILHAIQKIKSLLYGDFYKSVDALERIVEKAYVDTAKGEVTNSETGEDVSFSLRQKPEPKKKGVGYKVFVLKDGKLYPPMVANPDGAATPVGVWLDADAAPIAGESKTGRPQVKQGGKGTQGGSGKLAYRPGWHLGVVPYAIQFNRKDADGNKTLFPKNFVFAEVEYAADVDYQEEARQEGINPSGKYQHSLAGLKHLPTDGYYMYRTNPNPETDPWVITGAMKVNRILTRAEQADLVSKAGREPQQIQEGDIVTDDVVNSINHEIADAPKFSLKVYHGSGADFTEFDFDHMGEGAGSQAFGWGGYVTSSKKMGKSYATLMDNDPSKAYYRIQRSNGTRFAKKYPTLESFLHGDKQIAMNDKFTEKEKIDFYNEMKKLAEPYHNLYEVDIPDDNGSNYLDWDAPITDELIDKVVAALPAIRVFDIKNFKKDRSFEDLYRIISMRIVEDENRETNGVFNDDKAASKLLASLGYTGIKYKAGRNFGGAEENDTNYVIFKPEDMKITEHTKFSIKTYHGSQASFDHFDHSFMGSGEGAQAYGWGTYVSEVEGIAKAYAKQNAAKHGMPREYKIAQTRLNHAKFEYDKVQRRYDNSKAYIDSLKEDLQNYRESMARRKEKVAYFAQNNMPETVDKLLKQIKRAEDTIKVTENDINMRTNDLEGWKPKLEEVKKKYEEEQKKFDAIPKPQIERNLYSVDIPDDTGENYLGWDEKMTHRMRDIRKEILEDNGYKLVDSDDMRDYFEDRDGKEYELFKEQYKTGGTFYEELAQLLHSQKLASLALKEYGFDGVKVIADRNTGGNKEGKMNYVIFDENNAQITSHTKFSLRLKSAIDETETNPSDAQKENGNYKKGHIKFGGYDYTIENPKGSTRSGKDANGKEWKVTMHDTYGYIRGKFGKDGDHLDMFINDKADLDNWDGDVFVVDQVNPDGSFDEHKVMYGYDSMNDAEKSYLANYSKGWKGLGNITGASKTEFDKWLDTSNRKLKPFADYAKVKFSQAQSVAEPRQSLDDIKPVSVGAFGNIYNQFRGNAKAAIEFLKKVRGGEAVGALHHKDIGDIDLVWGKEGTGHSDGYGLSKLVKYHPEVLDNLQEILNDMRVVSSSKNRVNLESETHKAGVRLTWDGERKSWLLTAFKKETSASDKRTDTAATSLEGDTALSQTEGSAAKIDNSSETAKENGEKFSLKDEKIKSVAEKFGVNEDDVAMYANAVEKGSTAEAARARANIKRYLLQANEDKISSFKDIIKYTKPINEALKENFGDLDAMIEERRKQVEAQRNAMEAARKRAQEEEEKRQKHLDELSLIPTDELDKRYMDAIANNDESTAREMLDEPARRNGYGDVDSDYQGQGAWAAPSNPQYESDEARRADIENSPDVNLEDIALGYNLQPDDYFDNPRAYMNNTAYGLESAHVIKNALDAIKNGEKDVKVKVYRAVPTSVKEGKLRNGDWVTPSKKYAEMHGNNRLEGKYRIIEDEVPANQLWWDGNDVNEFGFDDGREYRYKNAKNNRKLNDLITYDNKGNVIPPSKRFNSRKSDIRFSLAGERGAADMAEELKSMNTPDEVDDAIKTAIEDMPSGWKMANKKMIHIAQALGENRKAEIAGEEPKFSLKDGSLIKAGTYFSGGGLVEEGLKGIIDPVVAVEYDEKISGVYRNNFGQHIVTADVRDVDPKELVKHIDGEVEYFHASPVCKNYSQAKSNHAEVELDKETAASTAEFINAIKPKVVTIENVKGYKDSEAMKTITDALDANGYTWDADVYNAADYGGYTNRERLIVRAVRDGKLPAKPEKMARKSGWYETVADIIPTLTEKKNGVAPWMDIRLKADGIDWRNIDKPLYVMGSAYADGKIPHAFADELLPTLRTKSGDVIVMPDGKVYRAMGRVLARVSGVSDDYKMPFSENLSHTIIGNGIPTQLTEHVIAPLLQNTLRPTTPEDGNTKFSLRYDQFEHDLNQWKKDNNLPKDAQRPTIPQRNAGESAVDFLRRVDEYRKQMALWKTAPTYEQHLLSDDTALGEFNRELQRGSVLKRIAFQDSMLAIRKAQEAIMKEVGVDRLNMAEDAYTAENRSHGKGKNEFEEYNNEFLQPLRKAYHQMKKVLGDSYDNVRIYMMAKHGLERDAQMAFKKSLEADYEDVAQRSAAYKAYKGDMNRMGNDSDFELGYIDFNTWRQKDDALRAKYSPSYMNYRYDKDGTAYDYSGLSALFGGTDFEEAASKLVRDIESSHVVEVQDLWNATNAATKKILRDGYKAGMMSKDTYQYVRDMYSHYIPLRGWDGTTADQVWDYIGGGKGAFNQTLKTAHGRTSIADDPIAYIENMAESGILLNNKNWVKQHLMLLAQNHPTSLLTLSKAWYVKSTDANGNEEWIPATPQITSQMDSNQVKAAIDAFEKKMEQMAQTGDATQKRDGLNIAYPQTHSEEREHEVRVMKDGEEYVIYVNGDPQLAQAMNNTRAHRVREIHSGKRDRAAAWLGRKMAAAYTSLSPLFIPSNYFRDLTMTLASTAIREDGKYNYLLRKNLATSWNLGFMLRDYQNGKLRDKVNNGNATPKEQMFYDFMMNGGETGFVSSLDVEDLKKKFKNDLKDLDRWKANPVKVGHTIMDGIEFLNRMIEDSNRFAIYMTSIQYGRSIDEAVNDAKDVTLNFNRKGTGEHSWQTIRNLYLFINPAVQSLQTLGALVKHHPFKFTAVTASWLASGVLVPIVNAALMSLLGGDDDKDKYWQFTKWDRRNNLIMWVPFTHEYVKIPLAQEFRAFYGVGDMIASKMMGGELAEESWSQYAEDLLGQVVDMLPLDPTGYDGNIAVSLMPNAIRPIFELVFNVDFTGKPLFKDTEYNKYDPNFTKAYVGTPDWLVRASKMVNSIGNDYPNVQQNSIDAFGDPRYNLNNPAVVDHVLSSYLGGAYTMGSQILGVLTKSLNDPKEIKVADIPLFSKFVSNPDDRPVTKKQGDEFWNMKENHDRAANTLSKLKKQAKVDGDYSMLERFYGSEEYKQYKQDDVKVKKYEEDKKKERAEESGEEYRPHKLNAEDIYKAHATPKDDFEDLKLKQLYTKLNGFKTSYDLLVDTDPSQSDGYYNTNKAAIDAIDEISLDKQEISELKKGFLDDGKDAYNAEDMKQIRELRKNILSVLEKANKVVVANQKAKAKKK